MEYFCCFFSCYKTPNLSPSPSFMTRSTIDEIEKLLSFFTEGQVIKNKNQKTKNFYFPLIELSNNSLCWPNFWKTYHWNPKYFEKIPEKVSGLYTWIRYAHYNSISAMPWVPSKDCGQTLSTESEFFGYELLRAPAFFHFSLGWPFPAHLYFRFNKHFWATIIYYRYLLGTTYFVFSKSLWTL